MKRLVTICATALLLSVTSGAFGAMWEIQDAGLQDTVNFVNTSYGIDGNLNSRTDIPGNPGTQFNITLTNALGGWTDITIGDNFDLPSNNAGLVPATGNSGNLIGFDGFTMTIENPGTEAFAAALYMNTGWTDPPDSQPNRYYQNGDVTWFSPGDIKTLVLDFSNAALWNGSGYTTGSVVANLNHVTDIGFKIGANLGNAGEVISGTAFNVNVVPVPGAVLLGMLGLSAAGIKLRKYV